MSSKRQENTVVPVDVVRMEESMTTSMWWYIRGLQLSGYFPFAIEKGKINFTKRWIPLVLWSLVIVVVSVPHILTFVVDVDEFMGDILKRQVEKSSVRLVAVLMVISATVLKLFGYFRNGDIARCWALQCKIIEAIFYRNDLLYAEKLQKIMCDLKARSKRMVLYCSMFAFLVMCLNISGMVMAIVGSTVLELDVLKILGNSLFWAFITSIDQFFWFWIYHFLCLYTSILNFLQNEVQGLNREMGLGEPWINVYPVSMQVPSKHAAHKLAHVIDSFFALERAVEELNVTYGSIIIMEMAGAVGFVLVHSFCFVSSIIMGYYAKATCIAAWTINFACRIVFTASESSQMGAMSKSLARELLVVSRARACIGETLATEATAVSHWMTSQPPRLSPGNFFNVDKPLIVAIFSAVTTYLIILLQFRQAEKLTSI